MQEKYDDEFFADLQSIIERGEMEEILRNTLGLESRDDPQNDLNATKNAVPSMTFEVADITENLNYPDESFDFIVCKKTLDVILCSAGSVANARSMLTECFRLLNKDHGVMMIISSASPEDRWVRISSYLFLSLTAHHTNFLPINHRAVFFENDAWSGVENIKLPRKKDDYQFDQRRGHER